MAELCLLPHTSLPSLIQGKQWIMENVDSQRRQAHERQWHTEKHTEYAIYIYILAVSFSQSQVVVSFRYLKLFTQRESISCLRV